jgi:glycylpeptide N-tetradecanoyltransferase
MSSANSSQKAKVEEIDNTDDPERVAEDGSSSEPDDDSEAAGVAESSQPSSSSKKKKKKKSKAMRVLNALKGKHEIPQAIVDQVLDTVKAKGGQDAANANEADVREALEQMKIMDVVQGKAGIGGKNKKDLGEHKVIVLRVQQYDFLVLTLLRSSGQHNLFHS